MFQADRPNALVVVAHPRAGSFGHALAQTAADLAAARGWSVQLRDLYAEGFDPVLTADELDTTAGTATVTDPLVLEHQRLLAVAQLLVVVHPNWWGKPPAMMAGWMDRVLAPGVLYRLATSEGAPEPLLQVRHLVVLDTSDTPPDRERDVFGDPLEDIWSRCVGEYLPSAGFTRRTFGPVGASSPEDRQRWPGEVARSLPRYRS